MGDVMQTFKGKYNTATVFSDDVEYAAVEQIHRFLDHPAFERDHIAIMPDVHAGAGAVIGFTAQIGNKIIPNVVGVDIGCGILAYKLPPDTGRLHFDRFDKFVRANVPSGFDVRQDRYEHLDRIIQRTDGAAGWCSGSMFGPSVDRIVDTLTAGKKLAERDVFRQRVWNGIGSLGGGNHFIKLDRADDGRVWLVIHCGSRNFGLQVAVHHQKHAVELHGKMGGLEWLDGPDGDAYCADMQVAQSYALLNRRVIAEVLLGFFGAKPDDLDHVESVHNFIDFGDGIIRKGAIAARKDQPVIIPLTMADGAILGRGCGNIEWNCSAPHGAGRVMSRRKAKETIDADHYAKRMREAGVWSSCVGQGTLDEAPMAYRRPKRILDAIGPAVVVEQMLKPIYNFKAGAE